MQPFANLRLKMGRYNRILLSVLHPGRSKAEASVSYIMAHLLMFLERNYTVNRCLKEITFWGCQKVVI